MFITLTRHSNFITPNNNAHNLAIKCQFKNIYQNIADKYENVRVYKFYLVTSQSTNSEGNISSSMTSTKHSTTTTNDNGFETPSTNNDHFFDNFTNWGETFLNATEEEILKRLNETLGNFTDKLEVVFDKFNEGESVNTAGKYFYSGLLSTVCITLVSFVIFA
ncbi:unnamed protein product [Heterobilharzia americana]|nr:unnamed protein product [Heterobilharzia americana]